MVVLAALTEICTDSLRDLVYQNTEVGTDYRRMKEKHIAWTSNRVAANRAADMDVGTVAKGYEDWQWNGGQDQCW